MGSGSKKAQTPDIPDPYDTARAEAQLNRLDTFSPAGSGVRHGYTDEGGNFVAGAPRKRYNSAQQYVESDYERMIREALEPASVDITRRVIDDNVNNMPDAPRVRDRSDVAQDVFDRSFSIMSPGIDKANERLLTNLQARGIPIGSEAFNDAYGEQLQTTQDTIARLAMDANLAAGQEKSREFSLDQSARSSAISEIVAAMGGGYNPPNTTPSGQAPGVNYSDLVANQYQQQAAAAQNQNNRNMQTASTLGTIGSALIKSTEKAKTVGGLVDDVSCADAVMSLDVMQWSYLPHADPIRCGEHHIGPMAEQFHEVTGLGDGRSIPAVDYLGLLLSALQNAFARIEHLEALAEIRGDMPSVDERLH